MVEPQAGTGIAGLTHILLDWFAGNKALTGWLIFLSVALSVVYAVLTYRAVGKISPDYFVTPEPTKGGWRRRHPVQRWAFRVSKNLLGGLVFLAGVAMLVLPGQGMLTILLGLSLLDFPGKRKLELKIVRLRGVKRVINWIRAKAGAAPLILPPKMREKTGIEAVLLRGLGLTVLGMGAPVLLCCFVVGGSAAEWTFTLISLLLRLYDYQGGSIKLDGTELRELGRRHVRSRIGVVLQEPFLYAKTVGENVRVGRGEADDDEVRAAAAAAAIHESIEGFDGGYGTLVGERGVTLSGGQRQRLAIARALLKEPDILVLDDALSAVDTRTETEILGALRSRRHRRTTILTAHRISSIHGADQILVLEDGTVVQGGSHKELVAAEGPYRRLWEIQGALEDEIESGGDGHE